MSNLINGKALVQIPNKYAFQPNKSFKCLFDRLKQHGTIAIEDVGMGEAWAVSNDIQLKIGGGQYLRFDNNQEWDAPEDSLLRRITEHHEILCTFDANLTTKQKTAKLILMPYFIICYDDENKLPPKTYKVHGFQTFLSFYHLGMDSHKLSLGPTLVVFHSSASPHTT